MDWDEETDEFEDTVECPYCGSDIYEDAERCPCCENYITEFEVSVGQQPTWVIMTAVFLLVVICAYFLLPLLS